MKALLISLAMITTTAAIAQAPAPAAPAEYTLRVTPAEIQLLGLAIDELPARVGRPLAQRLMSQVNEQDSQFAAAKKKAEEPKE